MIDASRLEYVDNVGIALLFDLYGESGRQRRRSNSESCPALAGLVAAYDPKTSSRRRPPIRRLAYSHLAELPPSRSTSRVTCSASGRLPDGFLVGVGVGGRSGG